VPAPRRRFTLAKLLILCGLFALALGAGATVAGGQSGGTAAPEGSAPATDQRGGLAAPGTPAGAHAAQTTETTAPTTPTETVPTTAPTAPTETLLPETALPTGTGGGGGGGGSGASGHVLAMTGLSVGAIALAGLLLCAAGLTLRRRLARER
jgi:hypothetical protein